ncbi:butyrate kinase [candidate division WOR-3 bacterium]|nr:butyrate kinase [candidate division WOR-3 bacterium]
MCKIIVINPGSTSTLIALFENEKEIRREKIEHPASEIKKYSNALEQLEFRKEVIKNALSKWGVGDVSAVIGRGGPLKPLRSGTYKINETMVNDIKEGRVQAEHISNIGPLLAYEIGKEFNVPLFTADPVSVDEFEPLSRVSGIPELKRIALQHTLNIKAMAKKVADEIGKPLEEINLIVAHLGGGISICPLKKGCIIDANNANEEGPFSPERAGTLPATQLVKLCFSKKYDEKWLRKRIIGNGGLTAYLGTNKVKEVENRISAGDKEAKFYLEAMAYQIAKEIGAMATVLKGKVDAVVMTGGAANSEFLIKWIKERVSFIAPIFVYPGENEMLALAQSALRILKGEEKEKVYK